MLRFDDVCPVRLFKLIDLL